MKRWGPVEQFPLGELDPRKTFPVRMEGQDEMRETMKNRSTMPLMALTMALAMALALALASVAWGAEGHSSKGGKSDSTVDSKEVAKVVV
jgi:hypothetical protein